MTAKKPLRSVSPSEVIVRFLSFPNQSSLQALPYPKLITVQSTMVPLKKTYRGVHNPRPRLLECALSTNSKSLSVEETHAVGLISADIEVQSGGKLISPVSTDRMPAIGELMVSSME